MKRHFVDSTDLRSVGYNQDISMLEIEFHSGGIYQYSNIPYSMCQNLMSANSKGRYFKANIKDFPDKYPCTKIR